MELPLRQDARVRRRTRTRDRCRALIHLLNQRYRVEFDRAERLRAQLVDIKASRAWRLLIWLRSLKAFLSALSASLRFNFHRRDAEDAEKKESSPVATSVASKLFQLVGQTFLSGLFRADRNVCPTGFETVSRPQGRVSIVIPFKDQVDLLHGCLTSLERSSYRRFEVILVDNGSSAPRTRRYLQRLQQRRRRHVVTAPGPFNFSRLCNLGAEQARGDYLLFLNNDTEVLAPDWLEHVLIVAQQPQTGIVGATLLYPDLTIQHAGMVPQPGGAWQHVYRGCPFGYDGEHGELRSVREAPAVTGACLLIGRDLFLELGGFDERLPVTHNDVDLCRRVRERGLRVLVTPHAQLLHYESLSRGYTAELPNA
jgi:GT2 family glycosyltransferase